MCKRYVSPYTTRMDEELKLCREQHERDVVYIKMLKSDIKLLQERNQAEHKVFNDIRNTAKKISPSAAVIRHLEEVIEVLNKSLLAYQDDYRKYGKFYKELRDKLKESA